MSRLGPDHRPPPPRDSPPHLHDPLQPRAPSPRTRAASARPDKRGPAAERRRNQTPRPTRRTDPRIPPRRSMNRRFETPQDRSRSPSWLTPDALTGAPFPNDAQHERLLTAAPRGGLEPPPAGRLRRAKPPSPAQHRSRNIEASTATLPLRSWHTDLDLLLALRPHPQHEQLQQPLQRPVQEQQHRAPRTTHLDRRPYRYSTHAQHANRGSRRAISVSGTHKVATRVLLLASERTANVTGASYVIDGGLI